MDDVETYGEELFRLGFGEAVSRSLLTDYKVLVLTVSEDQIADQMQSSLAQGGDLTLDDAARIVGCWNALAKRSVDTADYGKDIQPMRTAVAFARDIKTSKRFASSFRNVAEDYRLTLTDEPEVPELPDDADGVDSDTPSQKRLGSVEVRHVDGSMNIMERTSLLSWLSGDLGAPAPTRQASSRSESEGTSVSCRILSNARCLSEGVDVPALDAVMFLSPRKSQVDIVQSVGRVMRLAPGKQYGYIILPVAIPSGMSPEDVLSDNDTFRVVWEVLQALRAHDERFDAMVNKIDLNQSKPDKIAIIDPFGAAADDSDSSSTPAHQQAAFDLGALGKWREAIYARLVQKVGSRRYWEQWAKDVAAIAARHRKRLAKRVQDPEVAAEFERFLAALRANLNDSITSESAIDMLSQHLVTKPVFDAVFDGYDFAAENPVAQVMGRMLRVLWMDPTWRRRPRSWRASTSRSASAARALTTRPASSGSSPSSTRGSSPWPSPRRPSRWESSTRRCRSWTSFCAAWTGWPAPTWGAASPMRACTCSTPSPGRGPSSSGSCSPASSARRTWRASTRTSCTPMRSCCWPTTLRRPISRSPTATSYAAMHRWQAVM